MDRLVDTHCHILPEVDDGATKYGRDPPDAARGV